MTRYGIRNIETKRAVWTMDDFETYEAADAFLRRKDYRARNFEVFEIEESEEQVSDTPEDFTTLYATQTVVDGRWGPPRAVHTTKARAEHYAEKHRERHPDSRVIKIVVNTEPYVIPGATFETHHVLQQRTTDAWVTISMSRSLKSLEPIAKRLEGSAETRIIEVQVPTA